MAKSIDIYLPNGAVRHYEESKDPFVIISASEEKLIVFVTEGKSTFPKTTIYAGMPFVQRYPEKEDNHG